MNKKEAEDTLAIARKKGKTIQDLEEYILKKENEHKRAMLGLYYMLEYWSQDIITPKGGQL